MAKTASWFKALPKSKQRAYLKAHPNSKFNPKKPKGKAAGTKGKGGWKNYVKIPAPNGSLTWIRKGSPFHKKYLAKKLKAKLKPRSVKSQIANKGSGAGRLLKAARLRRMGM